MQDASLVTVKESTSKTKETVVQPEEKQPIKCKDVKKTPEENFPATSICMTSESSTENVDEKHDSSVLEKRGDQADCLEKETFINENVISAPQLVTKNESIS